MIHVKNSTQYYINERALTFSENDLDDPQRVAVSLVSGTAILVHVPGTIDFASDGNYERWTMRGYSTKIPDGRNDAHYVFARLSRTDRTALIVFSVNKYNIDGSITTENEADGSSTTTDPSSAYFYIQIGELTATDGRSDRELTYDSGLLGTKKGNEQSNSLNDMWELDKYSTPWLIRAKQWLQSFTVKGFITLLGGLVFKNGDTEKMVSDIKRSTDSDEDVPISDESIPTTKYVEGKLETFDDRFLRKDQDDGTPHNLSVGKNLDVGGAVKTDEALTVGQFQQGVLGSGASIYQDSDKNTYIESDFLKIRKKATFTDITVQELKHVGGEIILSPASMVCSKVEETVAGYKCYFNAEDYDGRKIYNEFEVGDQARCQTFNLEVNSYYWRLVTEVGEDFIVLSKTDCDTNSDMPKAGDNISQLGNRNTADRQNAIILSAYGSDAPSYKQYKGINNYSLVGKEVTKLSPDGNRITGDFISESTGKNLSDELEAVRVDWNNVLAQTDKEFTMWFYEYEPTLDNMPATEWVSEELKQLHDQDLFYNVVSGHAYRFEYKDGEWVWTPITDMETIKALENASKAQATADSKIRNFVEQPVPPYDKGDRWCNATYKDIYEDDDLVCIRPRGGGDTFQIDDWRVANGYKAGIKNLGDSVVLYAKQVEQNTTNLSTISTSVDRIDAKVSKIELDEEGKVKNIDTSNLVLEENYATLFTEQWNGNATARAEIGTFITKDKNGNIESGVNVSADQISFFGKTIINGNFVVDEDGNLTLYNLTANGTVNAVAGKIAGFEISGDMLTNNGMNNTASLIFTNTNSKIKAIIGGASISAVTGLNGVCRFENLDDSQYYPGSINYAAIVSAQGAHDNIALQLNGGAVCGLALKTHSIGGNTLIASTAPTSYSETINRNVGSLYVSTMFNWKESSSSDAVVKTRDIYITLPDMEEYDDGHIIMIKRGVNDGRDVYIHPGRSHRMVLVSGEYVKMTGNTILYNNASSYATPSQPLKVDSEGDAMTLVYHKGLSVNVDGADYYGVWVQYKHPRNW